MITITKASKTDAKELLRAKIDAFSWDVETYGYGPPNYDSLELFIKSFDIDNVYNFKILINNKIIGGITVFALEHRHYHLGGLYIKPEYQNLGIGSMTMDFLFSVFDGAEKWTLETPYRSFRNHHFYEKLGFRKIGQSSPAPDGFYVFLYEKVMM